MSVACGKVNDNSRGEIMNNKLIEYMKLHRLSLIQDWEKAQNNEPLAEDEYDPSDDYFEGAIAATEHLLSVATDMMNDYISGKEYK
jgi:hypothetical protein